MYHYFTYKAQSAEAGEGGMNHMRRKLLNSKLIGILAVLLVLFMAAGVAQEERTDASGQWKYVLEDGGATITGYMGATITGYEDEPDVDLNIPSELGGYPVTRIGAWAFEESYITTAQIPDGVTGIGEGAFAGCFLLQWVRIPNSVTDIGAWAFNGCSGLSTVSLPNSLTSIGEGAFYNCGLMYGGLKRMTIPAGVTFIGEQAFAGSKSLTLAVTENSYAEHYAKRNNIAYEVLYTYKDEDRLPYEKPAGGVQVIQPATDGYGCDFAYINGWTLTKQGGINDQGKVEWGLYGLADFRDENVLLMDKWLDYIIPCGDSFVYRDRIDDNLIWLVCKPGEEPQALPLEDTDGVFYGFDGGCWHTVDNGANSQKLYSIDLNGKNKRSLGTVKGMVCGVLADSSVVLVDYRAHTVSTWQDGKYTVLYTSPDLKGVKVVNDSVWAGLSDSSGAYFGRIENGALRDRQEGFESLIGRTANQFVFLVRDHLKADEADVLLIDDMTRSYVYLGRVPFCPPYVDGNRTGLEVYSDHLVYWGKGRYVLDIPSDMSEWTSYEH